MPRRSGGCTPEPSGAKTIFPRYFVAPRSRTRPMPCAGAQRARSTSFRSSCQIISESTSRTPSSRKCETRFRSSAAVTSRMVVVGARDKLLHAVDPKTGRGIWTFATKARIDGSPVVVGDRVFVGSADGRLYGVDLMTGKELWRFEAGGYIVASPAVAGGRLVIGTDAGDLYSLGAE